MKGYNQLIGGSVVIVGTLLFNACVAVTPVLEQNVDKSTAFEADAARYTALAEYYTAQANRQKAIEANAARYAGLANYFAAGEINRQRSIETESARHTGLAIYFTSQKR